ncbi:hypothetical protein [Niabella aurantiaca]|nr:hypothetical protein [Niabella aurantiaca]
MEDYLIGIGKRIKAIRKNKCLTINNVAGRADLSKMAGPSPPFWSCLPS